MSDEAIMARYPARNADDIPDIPAEHLLGYFEYSVLRERFPLPSLPMLAFPVALYRHGDDALNDGQSIYCVRPSESVILSFKCGEPLEWKVTERTYNFIFNICGNMNPIATRDEVGYKWHPSKKFQYFVQYDNLQEAKELAKISLDSNLAVAYSGEWLDTGTDTRSGIEFCVKQHALDFVKAHGGVYSRRRPQNFGDTSGRL